MFGEHLEHEFKIPRCLIFGNSEMSFIDNVLKLVKDTMLME